MATVSNGNGPKWQPSTRSADVMNLNVNASPLAARRRLNSASAAQHDTADVRRIAGLLAADVIDLVTGTGNEDEDDEMDGPENNEEIRSCRSAMRRIVGDISTRYGEAFADMTSRLLADIGSRPLPAVADVAGRRQMVESIASAFDGVVAELLADGRCNWGRVATIYALAYWLARHIDGAGAAVDGRAAARVGGGEDWTWLIEEFKPIVGRVVVDRMSVWIGDNGGWVEFDNFFRKRPESSPAAFDSLLPWRSLLVAVVGFGAAAVLTGLRN